MTASSMRARKGLPGKSDADVPKVLHPLLVLGSVWFLLLLLLSVLLFLLLFDSLLALLLLLFVSSLLLLPELFPLLLLLVALLLPLMLLVLASLLLLLDDFALDFPLFELLPSLLLLKLILFSLRLLLMSPLLWWCLWLLEELNIFSCDTLRCFCVLTMPRRLLPLTWVEVIDVVSNISRSRFFVFIGAISIRCVENKIMRKSCFWVGQSFLFTCMVERVRKFGKRLFHRKLKIACGSPVGTHAKSDDPKILKTKNTFMFHIFTFHVEILHELLLYVMFQLPTSKSDHPYWRWWRIR